jgi:Ca2+-binding RTX toxin-like protein
MATINHSAGADIIVPNNNGTTYRGLGGDDTYILSNSIAANAAITIVDTSGANKIQLVDGLSVASTKFAADAVQLTLSNGAVVTINGASNFTYDLGGNTTAGTTGSVSSFADFASGAGVASLPASGSVAGASNVTVNGTSWSGVAASYSYTLSKDASQITEGGSVTYTVTSNSAVTADTSLTWTAIGSTNGSTVDKASANDIDAQSGTVTISAGSSSATFSVTALADSVAEGIEGLQISVFSPDSATIGTSTILVNNSGASSSSQTFNGSTGVDNFIGASGADTFDFSTTGELNDVDTLDGAGGSDILSVTNATGTLTPNIENIETVNVTASGALTVNLANTASTFASLKAVSSASNNVSFTNLSAIPGKVGISNGDGDLSIGLKASAVSGTSDSITIELAGAGTDSTVAITTTAAGSSAIESATINSISAANTLAELSLDGASSLTITGDQSLILTQALGSSVTTIDASAMNGAVGLALGANPGAAAVTITGSGGVDTLRGTASGADNISAGGGNDTITFATDGQLTSKDVVDGGAGTDTVSTANATTVSSVLGGLSNVEKLALTGSGASITLTSDVNPTTFDLGNTGDQTVTLNDAYAQDTAISVIGDAASADSVINNSGVALTVSVKSSELSAADVSTAVNMVGNFAANATSLVLDSVAGLQVGATITIGSEELEVTALNVGTKTATVTRGQNETTAAAADNNDVVTFDSNTALTVTGSATASDSLVIYATGNGNVGTGATTITSIDAITINSQALLTGVVSPATRIDMGASNTPVTVTSNLGALDGTLTLDFDQYTLASAAASGAVNYTGGVNSDVIFSGQSADIINTGAGNDTIHLTAGSNTVDAGTGVDTIFMGSGTDNISAGAGNDTIAASAADLLANDIIDGGDGVDTLTVEASSYADESVFGGVTNVEKIKPIGADSGTNAITLNSNIEATIFDLSDDSNATITLSAGYTNATTIDLGADVSSNTDSVINGGTTGANIELTVNTLDADAIDSTTTITGGTGTDTINITNFASGGTSTLTNATFIDVINVIDYINGADVTLTLGTNGAVSTPLTINGTTLDAGEVLTVAGANSLGNLTINSGAGADILTGGNTADTIFGNAGNDTIDGKENSATKGADNISGGAGNDIINVTTAETEFTNSSTSALVTDTVDGGAGTDTLAFGVAATLTKAELGNISNVEKMTLADTSTITLSDAFLTSNPGIALTLANGTINAGAGTTADPTITLPVTYTAGSGAIKITTGTADDTFNTAASLLIDVSDTIDGGAGSDTIAVYNEGTFGTTNTTGDAVTLALDIYHTNIEKILVVDAAADDSAGDVTITIATAYTGTALTIDATALDQNALTAGNNESLTVTQASADLAAITLTSGAGADIITTGAANDIITTGDGIDTIVSNGGDDVISTGAGNDAITAGIGRDNVDAGSGNDVITVATDSHFEVSGGTETIDGGTGVDTLSFTAAAAHDFSSAEMGSVKNIEVITFGATGGSAAVIGLSDTFMSNNNDAITIVAPLNSNTADTMKVDGSAVGTGEIRLILKGDLNATNDTLIGGAGNDVLQVGYASTSNTVPDTDGSNQELQAADVFTGNGGIDVIELHNVGNFAAGTDGDTKTGTIVATIDFDNVTGVEKMQVMDSNGFATGSADPITITIAALNTPTNMPATFEYDGSIIADASDVQDFNYSSQTTSDNALLTTDMTITTGAGADKVGGSGGDDVINTGLANDTIFGGGRSDTIDGGSGDDLINGGDETALTGVGDSLSGGAGADTIDGDAGADTILGGDGNDIITGGTGADILTGGSGSDSFLLPTAAESGGTNIDTITDFATGVDTIAITLTAANLDTATDLGATAFSATDLGDVANFSEVEAILSKVAGEAVYVKDLGQIVIDINGDSQINSNDIRVNLTGSTAYDDADVIYNITGVSDETLVYTLGDGADTFAATIAATTNAAVGGETINGGAGADTITSKGFGASVINGGAGNDIIDVSIANFVHNNSSNMTDSATALVVDDITGLELGQSVKVLSLMVCL